MGYLQPLDADLKALEGGYLLRTMTAGIPTRGGDRRSQRARGLLCGSFAWLRALQTGADLARLDQRAEPKVAWRMLNHWDNLDRTVERSGYAGQSIWNWWELPTCAAPLPDYARANASLGINGVVLNNVNSKPEVLASSWLPKVAAIAEELRPMAEGLPVGALSSPKELGGLANSDPANPAVRAWWQAKVDEVYRLIPDFGGFLVKANSEGQPGLHDYGRSHAEGAAPMADALRPHGGLLIWRAFVYSEADATDRAKQAYQQFVPWDGQFASNVVVQVKTVPSTSSRASPSTRCSAPCPKPSSAWVPDHQGVPRLCHAPGLPGADVRGGAARRHPAARRHRCGHGGAHPRWQLLR